jgi:hypothetical protein
MMSSFTGTRVAICRLAVMPLPELVLTVNTTRVKPTPTSQAAAEQEAANCLLALPHGNAGQTAPGAALMGYSARRRACRHAPTNSSNGASK